MKPEKCPACGIGELQATGSLNHLGLPVAVCVRCGEPTVVRPVEAEGIDSDLPTGVQ